MRLLVLLLLASLCATAQDKPEKAADAKKLARTMPATAIAVDRAGDRYPSGEMEKTNRYMAGYWDFEKKNEAGIYQDSPSATKGTLNVHQGPGGLSLLGDMRMAIPNGELSAFWYMMYDPASKSMTWLWQDSSGPVLTRTSGVWDGEKLVFTRKDNVGGREYELRTTYSGFTGSGFFVTTEARSTEPPKPPAKVQEWKLVSTETFVKATSEARFPAGMGPRADRGPSYHPDPPKDEKKKDDKKE